MTAEITDKGNGTLTVVYRAESPYEANVMGMASMGKMEGVHLETGNGYAKGDESVILGAVRVPVIELLRGAKKE